MSQRVMASGAKPILWAAQTARRYGCCPCDDVQQCATSTGIYKTANGLGFSVGGVQVAELVAGGFKTGGKLIGEVFDWTGTTAPALSVFPYGQTLSRTTYADLWAFAQTEIAAGNTLYNNGNGSTTFGIPDMRGRLRAAKDNMGGSAASRLTATTMTADGNTLGATGGAQTYALTLAQLPTGITASGTATGIGQSGAVIPTVASGAQFDLSFSGSGSGTHVPATAGGWSFNNNTLSGSASVTSNNTSGSAHPIIQPTIITNCALFAGA
jgi:microcystin-dependent protein